LYEYFICSDYRSRDQKEKPHVMIPTNPIPLLPPARSTAGATASTLEDYVNLKVGDWVFYQETLGMFPLFSKKTTPCK
jgi:hypothetical protein